MIVIHWGEMIYRIHQGVRLIAGYPRGVGLLVETHNKGGACAAQKVEHQPGQESYTRLFTCTFLFDQDIITP
jgi:hypothetical protein